MTDAYTIAAFYQFTPLNEPAALRTPLYDALAPLGTRGTVLLAPEGVNGTLCMPAENIDAAMDILRALPGCAGLEAKFSSDDGPAFRKLKIRIKKEIVTMGVGDMNVCDLVGEYVAPQDWNAVISDPDTLVIDTRNDYEVEIGTFEGAENPKTDTFGEFPAWIDEVIARRQPKRIAMFCTGGIRCEKATSYARLQGAAEVLHLKGGILKYLETVDKSDSLWRGECFVFDERVSVGHGLVPGDYVLCRACQNPVSAEGQRDAHYQVGISCPACHDATTPDQKARFTERQHQIELARKRGKRHMTGVKA